ncbi:MAG: peptidylprolyl isomerase [Synergistaceae bacterium]|nr:peptidylprolyl isomerase [Synergistaceae bacterium]
MKKSFLYLIAAGILAVTASAVVTAIAAEQTAAPAAPQKDPERILATVEGEAIREKDVDQILLMAGPQAATYDNPQGRQAILEELIAANLFTLSGKKMGIDKTPAVMSTITSLTNQTIARAAIEKILQGVAVSEDEIKKFYDDNPTQFTTPEQIHVRHILVSDDVTSADTIKDIQAKLSEGVSFDVLAMDRSICPSAPQGGDLGFFSQGQMVPEFETAAFALQNPGDLSEPVKTSFGWHLIRMEERKPASTLAYDNVKPQIAQYLLNEKRAKKYQEVLAELKKEYRVEISQPVSGDAPGGK